jgi:hypothetical protein
MFGRLIALSDSRVNGIEIKVPWTEIYAGFDKMSWLLGY